MFEIKNFLSIIFISQYINLEMSWNSDQKFGETKVWIRALRDNRKVFCDLDNFDEFKIWNLAFLLSFDWSLNKMVFE